MVWLHDKQSIREPLSEEKKTKYLKDIEDFKARIIVLKSELPKAKSESSKSFIIEDMQKLAKKIIGLEEKLGRV